MPSHFSKLKQEVENGLLGKNQGIPISVARVNKFLSIRKRIYTLLGGNGGCLAKGTGIIMFNGTIKPVEDIIPGDVLMGPDSTARTVIELKRGVQQMYWIRQNKGDDYKVNEDHILHLRRTRREVISKKVIPNQLHIVKNKRKRDRVLGDRQIIDTVNIPVKEILTKKPGYLCSWKGYKVGVEMPAQGMLVDPYMLGIWLGDGSSSKSQITNIDPEILEYINVYSKKNGYRLTRTKISYDIVREEVMNRAVIGEKNNKEYEYDSLRSAVKQWGGAETNITAAIKNNYLCRGLKWRYKTERKISLFEKLKDLNLIKNKHIPNNYKYNSRENRLQLLAGILDTDGSRDGKGYNIVQKRKQLAEDIVYVCRSLGYYTSIKEKTASMKREDGSIYKCQVYKIQINGNRLYEIPCKVERKKIKEKSTRKMDALSTGITIEKAEVDQYYGFTLDKDNLFLLSDFTVTHNTGKTGYIDSTYVLEPYEWLLNNITTTEIRIEWIYRCMERSITDKVGKWACYKIWKDHGELIEPEVLMGWREDKKITSTQKDLFDSYEEYFTTMQDSHIVNIIAGQENPRGIFKQLEQYALERGKEEQISEWEKKYHPNNEHLIIMPVIDHAGKCRMETVDGSKTRKGTTDKLSEYMSIVRDRFQMSPVVISQFNRSIKSEIFNKQADPEPTQESFKDTGNMYDDADVVMTLFNPYKFKVYDHMGYDIKGFVDTSNGNNYFRSLKLIKSSYSADDIRWALAFNGAIGGWKTLPKLDKMDDEVLQDVKSLRYFRSKEPEVPKKAFAGFGNRKQILDEVNKTIVQ